MTLCPGPVIRPGPGLLHVIPRPVAMEFFAAATFHSPEIVRVILGSGLRSGLGSGLGSGLSIALEFSLGLGHGSLRVPQFTPLKLGREGRGIQGLGKQGRAAVIDGP